MNQRIIELGGSSDWGGGPGFLVRFDCDLHRDIDHPMLKKGTDQGDEATHFQYRSILYGNLKEKFMKEAKREPETIRE